MVWSPYDDKACKTKRRLFNLSRQRGLRSPLLFNLIKKGSPKLWNFLIINKLSGGERSRTAVLVAKSYLDYTFILLFITDKYRIPILPPLSETVGDSLLLK